MFLSAAKLGSDSYKETFVSIFALFYLLFSIGCDFVEHLYKLTWMCMAILIPCFLLVRINSIVSLSNLASFNFEPILQPQIYMKVILISLLKIS